MIMHKVTTLNQFIIERQAEIPGATGEFSRLLHHIGIAAKKVHREVNKAGLVDILGKVGSINVQGEDQQKLDVYADNTFMDELRASGECCGVATEENQDIVVFEEGLCKDGKYIICMDPLDGSSNIDVNVSVGTIFSIYRRKSPIGEPPMLEDFLQPGTEQVAAGYVIYGSSTMLVYTSGKGVNGFTLDTSIGEFCLSHPNMQTPEDGDIHLPGNRFPSHRQAPPVVRVQSHRVYRRAIGSLGRRRRAADYGNPAGSASPARAPLCRLAQHGAEGAGVSKFF